jgi:phosphomannomutase
MTKLFLFDVDNTLAHSGQKLDVSMQNKLAGLRNAGHCLGIVGGGTFTKIREQLGESFKLFDHVFSECGCLYHYNGALQYAKNIKKNSCIYNIDKIIKQALLYFSSVPYLLCGHLIDYRNGIVYISCIGMDASLDERADFLANHLHHRDQLLQILHGLKLPNISIKKGGSVGIAVYPSEWSKAQVVKVLKFYEYDEIYYYGDSDGVDGNDTELLHHPNVKGIVVKGPQDTLTKI